LLGRSWLSTIRLRASAMKSSVSGEAAIVGSFHQRWRAYTDASQLLPGVTEPSVNLRVAPIRGLLLTPWPPAHDIPPADRGSGGRVVMHRTANPRMPVRFRPGPPIFSMVYGDHLRFFKAVSNFFKISCCS
jgi:hypothetical protein